MLLKGNPVSKGIAVAPAYIYRAFSCDVHETYFQEGEESKYKQLFDFALKEAEKELDEVAVSFSEADADKAKIFEAHKEILYDEEIIEMVDDAIMSERKTPDFAVNGVFAEFIEILGAAKDPLIAARTADLRDVRNRLLRILHGEKELNLSRLPGRVVVVAHDLLPSDTATLDRANVAGIVTEVGGATSHSAIIARSYKIPAVLGVPDATEIIRTGDLIALDAVEGEVTVSPDSKTRKLFEDKLARHIERSEKEGLYLDKEPLTADGARIDIGINVGNTDFDEGYSRCDFIGLFRTEFLYMENDHIPTEEEQFEAYKKVLENANGKPVTLRTLDIGGDKTLKYMQLPTEENPFLGKRAVRLCFDKPELFMTQLRAALRASAFGELWLMFPMIGSVDDMRKAKGFVERAKNELKNEGAAYDDNVKVGMMIEIPSIAMIADLAAKEADFASVGTNDLCQYLMAADRMNAGVSSYCQNYSPAVVRTLKFIADSFNAEGKPISVCGEMGGDPAAARLLVGAGIKKLSMNSSAIASVKASLAGITIEQAKQLVERACSMSTEAEVLEMLKD